MQSGCGRWKARVRAGLGLGLLAIAAPTDTGPGTLRYRPDLLARAGLT
jgi:hypothetical protein